jgi:hypothetical protein
MRPFTKAPWTPEVQKLNAELAELKKKLPK